MSTDRTFMGFVARHPFMSMGAAFGLGMWVYRTYSNYHQMSHRASLIKAQQGEFGAHVVEEKPLDVGEVQDDGEAEVIADEQEFDGPFPEPVRIRLTRTYGYVASSVVLTMASAYTLNRLGLGMYLLKSRSLLSYLGMAGLTIGSSLVMLLTPYKYKIPKHLAWLAFNVSVAATLAPVMLFKKEAAIAGLITGAGVTGLSLVAANAPSRSFLWLAGPLSAGCLGLCAVGLAQWMWPTASFLRSLSTWGGMLLYSGFMLFDTQVMIERAKAEQSEGDELYDPINESVNVFLNSVQMFVRIFVMLLENKEQDQKKKKGEEGEAEAQE